MPVHRTPWFAVLLAASLLAIGGCADDIDGRTAEDYPTGEVQQDEAAGVEDDVTAKGIDDGAFDAELYGEVKSYDGETVTIAAEVYDIISTSAFTIAATGRTTVETEGTTTEELLVVHPDPIEALQEGHVVEVTGAVHTAFDLPEVENDLRVELDDNTFHEWGKEPYVEATRINTAP